jgi:hypothetical protein
LYNQQLNISLLNSPPLRIPSLLNNVQIPATQRKNVVMRWSDFYSYGDGDGVGVAKS